MRRSKVIFLAVGAWLGFAATMAFGQAASAGAVRDSLEVQKGRNEHVQSRSKKRFYTRDWDLSGIPPYVPKQKVFGTIRIWGTNYMGDSNLEKYWDEGFIRFHPDVSFANTLKTSNAALPSLYTGAADIAIGQYYFYLLESFQRHFGYNPFEITVLTGSYDVPGWSNCLAIYVNRANPFSKVTLTQLDGIFGAARTGGWVGTEWHPEFARGPEGNIRTWGQLGLTGEWADKRINVYGNNLRYGQATFMSDKILKGSDKWNGDLRTYANYVRADGTFSIGAAELISDLGKDRYGIAYSGPQNQGPLVKMIPVAPENDGPYVPPTIETVQDQSYPLVYHVYMYVNRVPGSSLDPKIKEYLRYVLSREGQSAVVRDGKYLPLTASMAREMSLRLE